MIFLHFGGYGKWPDWLDVDLAWGMPGAALRLAFFTKL